MDELESIRAAVDALQSRADTQQREVEVLRADNERLRAELDALAARHDADVEVLRASGSSHWELNQDAFRTIEESRAATDRRMADAFAGVESRAADHHGEYVAATDRQVKESTALAARLAAVEQRLDEFDAAEFSEHLDRLEELERGLTELRPDRLPGVD